MSIFYTVLRELKASIMAKAEEGAIICTEHKDRLQWGLIWCTPPSYVGGGHFPDSGGFRVPKYCYDIGKSMCDPRVTEVPPCGVFSTEMCWPDEEAGFRLPKGTGGFCVPREF
jgi:hypothetical protein